MNSQLYHAWYFGGPCDGLVVVTTRRDRTMTWSARTRSSEVPTDPLDRSMAQDRQALYELRLTRYVIDDGVPKIRREYQFVGWQLAPPTPIRSSWLAQLKNRLKRFAPSRLWLPLPEGRPQRPGQEHRPLSCPGRGLPAESR
jgi:hypothetical protein